MAKRKPTLTFMEMERKLGYKIDSLNYPDEAVKRFYSDLRPVPSSVYERIKTELEEHEKQRFRKKYETTSEKVLPEFGAPQVGPASVLVSPVNIVIDDCTWSGYGDIHT